MSLRGDAEFVLTKKLANSICSHNRLVATQSSEDSLFEAQIVREAEARLEAIDFPQTPFLDWVLGLGHPAPREAYVVAAARCIETLNQSTQFSRFAKAAQNSANIIDRIAEWVDTALRQDGESGPKLACVAGCNFCCSLRVNALPAEVANITTFIDENFSSSRRDALLSALTQYIDDADADANRDSANRPRLCPLNDNGLCAVYSVRPMTCRRHHSFSLAQCENAFVNWRAKPEIVRHALRKVCSDAVILASIDTFSFLGIESQTLDLPLALRAVLEMPSNG